jgi:hypothetical protein
MSHLRSGGVRARAGIVGGLLALGLAAGCGGDDDEARLEALTKELTSLRAGLAATRAEVSEREATAKAAQDALAQARGELRDTEQKIAAIEKQVGAHATDPVLFRLVQKQLLDDDELHDVAISAKVERGAVTLSGVVKDASLRERAVKIAESVPGVVSVQDRIQLAEAR